MLYHYSIYFKPNFHDRCHSLLHSRNYYYSHHVISALEDENLTTDNFDSILYLIQTGQIRYELIEVEENKYIDKFVIRVKYDNIRDMCIVLGSSYDKHNNEAYLFIRTIWINRRGDKHFSLDESKYVKGE